MRIYFDMCSLQRPLDDPTQLRVRLEGKAISAIIEACIAGRASVVSSFVLEFENRRSPRPERHDHVDRVLARAIDRVPLTPTVERLAATFREAGIKALDASYLASAVAGGVDFFCTCDDRLLRKGRTVATGTCKVVSPLELVTELGL